MLLKFNTNPYPFGSPMSSRSLGASGYKYGFNGKENDRETVGTGEGTQDYGMRIYNPALGRFLSVDPLFSNYPWYTPYQFSGNKPIWAVDLDGLEEFIYTYLYKGDGKPAQLLSKENNVRENADGTKTNIKTGELFNDAEIGTVQYAYMDASKNALIMKKNMEGDYEKGEGDIMPLHQDNMMGTIYTGKNNPKQENGKKDYRREPLNNLDYAAYKHDKSYDKLTEKYKITKYATDRALLAADIQLIKDYVGIATHKTGETGAKNSVKERFRAGVQVIKMIFYITPKVFSSRDSSKK